MWQVLRECKCKPVKLQCVKLRLLLRMLKVKIRCPPVVDRNLWRLIIIRSIVLQCQQFFGDWHPIVHGICTVAIFIGSIEGEIYAAQQNPAAYTQLFPEFSSKKEDKEEIWSVNVLPGPYRTRAVSGSSEVDFTVISDSFCVCKEILSFLDLWCLKVLYTLIGLKLK